MIGMWVIVVGPDCAGKTTIINDLAKVIDFPVGRYSRLEDKTFMKHRVLDFIRQIRVSRKENSNCAPKGLLFDRWYYPDDIIYEPLYSNEQSVLLPLQKKIEKEMLDVGAVFLYVTASDDVLIDRFNERGDKDHSIEDILEASRRYQQFMQNTKLPVIVADTSRLPRKDTVRNIVTSLILK